MSIRFRLLLIVGFVSSLVFISAFFLENLLFSKSFEKAREEVFQSYRIAVEQRRRNLEIFTATFLSEQLAQINVLLEAIAKFPSLAEWFSPTEENLKEGSWSNATTLLQTDDWIDFLQNTFDKKLLSLIVPAPGPFSHINTIPIEEGLAWVFLEETLGHFTPFLGIKLPTKVIDLDAEEPSSIFVSGSLPSSYILYDLERFRSLDFPEKAIPFVESSVRVPFIQGYELDEESFLKVFYKAIELAKDPSFQVPEIKAVVEKAVDSEREKKNRFDLMTDSFFDSKVEYSSELFMLWEITSLRHLSIFGKSMDDPRWPDAVSFSEQADQSGSAFFLKSTIGFSEPFFDDEAFFIQNPPRAGSSVSSSAAILKSPHPNEAFLANTVALSVKGQEKKSFLTIGFNLSDFLYNLTSTLNVYSYVVSNGKVLVAMNPEDRDPLPLEKVNELFSKKDLPLLGEVNIDNTEFFFTRLKPNPALDLYFNVIQPKAVAFGPLLKIQNSIAAFLKEWKIQREGIELLGILLLWILLIDLSKKITRPMVQLSSSLKHVKAGEWDLVKIPEMKASRRNEIKQLCDSFQDMVEGLKEKERLSTILNKVVSKEIACEILKGDILLGGEEKVVTMLFVDIRGFTKMTQNMAPSTIIDLLNKCMTKLSIAVEENKGVIDKYLGDGFMALYGAPIAYNNSPFCAIVSALQMLEIIEKWDQERVQEGLTALNIGIGVHTGSVCAGNMGAQNRLNYTVIGSHVNLASRLCYAAAPGEILITADTYLDPSVQSKIEIEDKGFMSFKGFDEKKQVYKVIKLKN